MKTENFYPSYFWAYTLMILATAFLGMWIGLVALGLTPPSPELPQAGSMGPALVIGFIWMPMIVLFFDISMGIFRSRVTLTEQGLDLTTTRFAIWKIRRVERVQLVWNEVWGVQVWEQSNPLPNAMDPMQVDYVIHTTKGKFCVTNKIWPQAREIGEAIALRLGRALDDVPAEVVPVSANRRRDTWGLKILHGLGVCSIIVGLLFGVLAVAALLGGTGTDDAGLVMILGGALVSLGVGLRRYHMQGMKKQQ